MQIGLPRFCANLRLFCQTRYELIASKRKKGTKLYLSYLSYILLSSNDLDCLLVSHMNAYYSLTFPPQGPIFSIVFFLSFFFLLSLSFTFSFLSYSFLIFPFILSHMFAHAIISHVRFHFLVAWILSSILSFILYGICHVYYYIIFFEVVSFFFLILQAIYSYSIFPLNVLFHIAPYIFKAYSLIFLSYILSYICLIILSTHFLTTYTLSCSSLCSDHIFSAMI